MRELADRLYNSTSLRRRGVDAIQLEEALNIGASCLDGRVLIEKIKLVEEKLREAEDRRVELSGQNRHIVNTISKVTNNVDTRRKRKPPTISTKKADLSVSKLLRVNSCPSLIHEIECASTTHVPLHLNARTPSTPRFSTKERGFGRLHQLMYRSAGVDMYYVPNTKDNL
jgi:hypothetical protein